MRWFFLLLISASAVWAQPLVSIETVPVGFTNNAPDTNGYGAVPYEYRIGKYEITTAQYAAFLNAVSSNPTNGVLDSLWDTRMATQTNFTGIQRSQVGAKFVYTPIGSSNRPAGYIRWFDAARFCNWLHNGATNGASTETGAYSLNWATNGIYQQNTNAAWYIPSENEWYKAAHYDPSLNGGVGGYHLYPTRSSIPPGNTIGPDANQANYFNGAYTVTGTYSRTTDVGSFSGSATYFGTFDQAGNVWEWNDGVVSVSYRGLRGGTWGHSEQYLRSTYQNSQLPTDRDATRGFRLAAPVLPTPVLAVEIPPNTSITSNAPAVSFGGFLLLSNSPSRTFVLRNTGTAPLEISGVEVSGAASADFQLTGSAVATLQPSSTNSLGVTFAPLAGGDRQATLRISNNTATTPVFVISLQGRGLAEEFDYDGDLLNDAAEFTMSALGFDWQISQPALVSSLFDNAGRAGLYTSNNVTTNAAAFGLYTATEYAAHFEAGRTAGQADVTTNPSAFNLFTQAQFDGNRTAGQQDVIGSPMAFGLYDSNSIMDLRMGGLMVPKAGGVATVTFQPQTTTDLKSYPFTNNGAPITFDLPMPADKGFMRWKAE